jgi:hypothetical protein
MEKNVSRELSEGEIKGFDATLGGILGSLSGFVADTALKVSGIYDEYLGNLRDQITSINVVESGEDLFLGGSGTYVRTIGSDVLLGTAVVGAALGASLFYLAGSAWREYKSKKR